MESAIARQRGPTQVDSIVAVGMKRGWLAARAYYTEAEDEPATPG